MKTKQAENQKGSQKRSLEKSEDQKRVKRG